MASYRIYLLDDMGKIATGIDVDCQDDEDAMAMAKTLARGGRAEVWESARLVGQVSDAEECECAHDEPMCADCANRPSSPASLAL
jgi:hypothetical protein